MKKPKGKVNEGKTSPKEDNGQVKNLAVNVKVESDASPFYSCTLCGKDSRIERHPVNKCSLYKNAKDRLDRLKELKGCLKCADLKHQTNTCRYGFNRCILSGMAFFFSLSII